MKEIFISKNDAGQRLDKFLTKALPSLPHSMLYRAIRTKKIKLNRKRTEPGAILAEGDTLLLFLPEDVLTDAKSKDATALSRIHTALRIVYEDEHLLLLDKRAGVTVHEDERGSTDTLLTAMQAYLYQKGEYDPDAEMSFSPALCNRLDRNTAGIVIAAKTAAALREMNGLIRDRRMKKLYLCAVHGAPSPREATARAYLLKNADENLVRIYGKNPPRNAKEIITKYRTLETRAGLSLLEVELLTGRTHQIRAHLAYLGHPLVGDGKYGVNREDKRLGFSHQALASYRLEFPSDLAADSPLSHLAGRAFTLDTESLELMRLFRGQDEKNIGELT